MPNTLGFGESAAQTTAVRATYDPEKKPYKTPNVIMPGCAVTPIHERPTPPVINDIAMIVLIGPTLSANMLGNYMAPSAPVLAALKAVRTNLPKRDPAFMKTMRYWVISGAAACFCTE